MIDRTVIEGRLAQRKAELEQWAQRLNNIQAQRQNLEQQAVATAAQLQAAEGAVRELAALLDDTNTGGEHVSAGS